jgi:hypothetical protein
MPTPAQVGGAKTIPELREAFERIETFAKDLAMKGGSARELVGEWKAVFGRKIDLPSAESYMSFIKGGSFTRHSETRNESVEKTAPSKKNKTRKARKMGGSAHRAQRAMHGGAAAGPIAGAPLDYQTRPGIDGPYGNFLPYVDGGFGVGVPAISQNYISNPRLEPTLDVGEGGNRPLQTGGAKKSTTAKRRLRGGLHGGNRKTLRGGSKFILSAAPTTALQDAVTAWRGQPLPVSLDPTSTAFKL